MKRQTRPFTVEVKQKRSYQKRGRSIWSDVDLSAALAETTREVEEMELPNRRLADSEVVTIDEEHLHKPLADHLMADSQDAESVKIASEPTAKAERPGTKKKPSSRSRKAKAEPRPPARKNNANTASQAEEAPEAAVRSGRKIYSEKERAQKLAQIEISISGGATLKSAVKQASISEQTYYDWKKVATPASQSDDLNELDVLDEENKRLKSLLAERLRKENAELKKKLGLQ
ncbi:transposase [Mesorhizobium sp. WSM2239]|uniref:Transposase n=2 Tax=unclassified Mesorhizobium TaxID=325217 RepID=A0AAU8D723_9HYPH